MEHCEFYKYTQPRTRAHVYRKFASEYFEYEDDAINWCRDKYPGVKIRVLPGKEAI